MASTALRTGNGHNSVQKVQRASAAPLTSAATTRHASLLSGTVRVLADTTHRGHWALGTLACHRLRSHEHGLAGRPAPQPVTKIRLRVSLSLVIIEARCPPPGCSGTHSLSPVPDARRSAWGTRDDKRPRFLPSVSLMQKSTGGELSG